MSDQHPSEPSSIAPMMTRLFVFFLVCSAAVAIFAPTPPMKATTAPATPPTSDCDLGAGPCSVRFDESHEITLSITPRPIRVVSPLTVEARFSGRGSNAKVTFTSTTMDMGTMRVALAPGDDGVSSAKTALPLCTTSTMQWQARIDVDLDGEAHHAIFAFVTERSTTPPRPEDLAAAGVAPTTTGDVDVVTALDPAVIVDATLRGPGGAVQLSELRGGLLLVTFGYASCPDICPMGLTYLAQTLRNLSDAERSQVTTLFVSVDPERDSLAHLATYGPFFHPDIRGVSGSPDEVKAAATTFGVSYARVGADGGPPPVEGYLIDHTAFTTIVDADGRAVARLAHAADPVKAAAAIRRFLPPPGAP